MIWTCIFFDPIAKFAVVPSRLIVAFVCILHWIACVAVISSCSKTCVRLFNILMPREKEVLHHRPMSKLAPPSR